MVKIKGAFSRKLIAAFLSMLIGFPVLLSAQQVEEIVVTARKRQESLQDIPMSVSVLTGAQLQDRGILSNYGVADFTVNFNTEQQVGRSLDRPIIRGMAAPSVDGEPNASYFIDGVFVSGSISTAALETIDRIEILRGPQSAQFGRATFSGAVNYITKKPTNELQGEINSRVGTSDDYKLGAWVSGPIIKDRLLYLLSANFENYGGQWRNSLQPDEATPTGFWEDPKQEGDSTRMGNEKTKDFMAKLTFIPIDGTEFDFKYSYTKGEDGPFPSLLVRELNCHLPTDPTHPAYETTSGAFCGTWEEEGKINVVNLPDFRGGVLENSRTPENPEGVSVAPADPGLFREQHRFLFEYTQEISDFELIARATYNQDDSEQAFDLDHNAFRSLFGLFNFDNVDELRDYSFEVRLLSPGDLPVRGQLGAYYYDRELKERTRSFPGLVWFLQGTPESVEFSDWAIATTENVAVFGGIEFDLSDQLTLSLEARVATDTKELLGGNGFSVDNDFDSFTPRITMRYQPADDLSLYFLAAKGNKPGDFNEGWFDNGVTHETTEEALANGDAVVEEEEAWTYELGAKTTWLDQRLTANLAVFFIDWINQGVFVTQMIPQEVGPDVADTGIVNAGQSEIYGLELETNFVLNENLTLIANYGYTHARFVQYNDGFYARSTGIDDPDFINGGNVSGFRIANSPEHSVVLGGVARVPVTAALDAFLRSDFIYESDRYTQSANFSKVGERKVVNMRAGFEANSWTLTAYVHNLLDDTTPVSALNFPDFDTGNNLENGNMANLWGLNPRRGRDWGLEFSYRF
jgi:outer membrane receptor protein involved in Fe transport